MLLTDYPVCERMIHNQDYVFTQAKLDGWRCVINTVTGVLYSRSGNIINLPRISSDILSMSGLPEWLDGELYCHGKTLGQIQSMIRSGNSQIKFYCFDCITPDVFSIRLNKINRIPETNTIRVVATSKIPPSEIVNCYKQYLAMGLEGAVIRLDRLYENKRSENIFRLKPTYND